MKAKKGDICSYEVVHSSTHIKHGTSQVVMYALAEIASTTRAGMVTKIFDRYRNKTGGPMRCGIASADRVNVKAAMSAYYARSDYASEFANLDELKDFLRSFLI